MKAKTIKAVIAKKMAEWWASIDNADIKALAAANTIVTGGSIASMLLAEPVNDFDVYFRTQEAAHAVADYYVGRFVHEHNQPMRVVFEDDRIRIVTKSGHRGETAGDIAVLRDPGSIEDAQDDTAKAVEESPDDDTKPKYRPVFISTNAVTLSHKVQLVFRFFGEPDDIHKNYDFVHCTNFWSSWNGELVLHKEALESLLAKELRYVGSKYPIASVLRLRKFIARHWTINAGQVLKMAMQISELDLTDIKVLEDQLTGVNVAYFIQVVDALKEKDPTKVNAAYLVEIIDRMF